MYVENTLLRRWNRRHFDNFVLIQTHDELQLPSRMKRNMGIYRGTVKSVDEKSVRISCLELGTFCLVILHTTNSYGKVIPCFIEYSKPRD